MPCADAAWCAFPGVCVRKARKTWPEPTAPRARAGFCTRNGRQDGAPQDGKRGSRRGEARVFFAGKGFATHPRPGIVRAANATARFWKKRRGKNPASPHTRTTTHAPTPPYACATRTLPEQSPGAQPMRVGLDGGHVGSRITASDRVLERGGPGPKRLRRKTTRTGPNNTEAQLLFLFATPCVVRGEG